MGRWAVPAVGIAVLLIGVSFVALAVATHAAQVALLFIVPVVTGSSSSFLIGVVLIFVGLFLIAAGGVPRSYRLDHARGADPDGPAPGPGATRATGGMILVGPIPIFFGSWSPARRRTYYAVVGLALTGFVLLWLFFLGIL
ncbi:MAG: DUF131 domain-containing protein [Thermoplasmata archaeon]